MSVIIFLLILDTVIQLLVCKVSLWWILCLIGRGLFCCRAIGATFKVKSLCKVEIVAVAMMLLFHIIFKGSGFPWFKFLFFILFSAIACLLMFLDEWLYMYTIEDVEDDD